MELRLLVKFVFHITFYVGVWSLEESTYSNTNGDQCDMCPPGSHLDRECTYPSRRSGCLTCEPGTFTGESNAWRKCLRCRECLPHFNMHVKKLCTLNANTVCACIPGFYWDALSTFCVPYHACGEGYGVLKQGTPENDVECEECPDGYFSDTVSVNETCMRHTDCESLGLLTVTKGSKVHDSECRASTGSSVEQTTSNYNGSSSTSDPVFTAHPEDTSPTGKQDIGDPVLTNQPDTRPTGNPDRAGSPTPNMDEEGDSTQHTVGIVVPVAVVIAAVVVVAVVVVAVVRLLCWFKHGNNTKAKYDGENEAGSCNNVHGYVNGDVLQEAHPSRHYDNGYIPVETYRNLSSVLAQSEAASSAHTYDEIESSATSTLLGEEAYREESLHAQNEIQHEMPPVSTLKQIFDFVTNVIMAQGNWKKILRSLGGNGLTEGDLNKAHYGETQLDEIIYQCLIMWYKKNELNMEEVKTCLLASLEEVDARACSVLRETDIEACSL